MRLPVTLDSHDFLFQGLAWVYPFVIRIGLLFGLHNGVAKMKELEPKAEISIDKVLFATDFSPATEPALSYAVTIADRYRSQLYVAHVINLESFELLEAESAGVMIKQAHDEANRKIAQLLGSLRLQSDRYQIVVAEGAISEVLLDIIRRNQIDVAVLGTHGRRAFKKLLMGAIAEEVFRMRLVPF
jgi:nucleotide-binding universal stress UspA family protein